MTEIVTLVAQFGFPAVMAVVVFFAYQRQTDKLMQVIEANTSAMNSMCKVVESLDRRVENMEETVYDLKCGRERRGVG